MSDDDWRPRKPTQQDAIDALYRASIIQPTLPSARGTRGHWTLSPFGEALIEALVKR